MSDEVAERPRGQVRGRPFPKGRSGLIKPGEAQAIARVFTTFVQTIETSGFDQPAGARIPSS